MYSHTLWMSSTALSRGKPDCGSTGEGSDNMKDTPTQHPLTCPPHASNYSRWDHQGIALVWLLTYWQQQWGTWWLQGKAITMAVCSVAPNNHVYTLTYPEGLLLWELLLQLRGVLWQPVRGNNENKHMHTHHMYTHHMYIIRWKFSFVCVSCKRWYIQ